MMRLLDRYILRQFVLTFVMLVLGLPLLFIVVDITDNLDRYLGRGLEMDAVALSYLYVLPQFVFFSLPIAGLVATVFTIGNMTRHQEIAAAKAGGVSFYRLVRPLLAAAAVLSVLGVGLGELIPVTNRIRAELLGERSSAVGGIRANFVFRTEAGRTLSVRRLDAGDGQINNLVLEREGSDSVPSLHQTAKRAHYQGEQGGWRLEDGYLRVLSADGRNATFAFTAAKLPTLEETPEDLLAEPKEPEEMRYQEMSRFIQAIERSGGNAGELRVERAQKISLPLALFVIVLFGAPMSTSSRRGGAAYGIGISLAVTMVYLMLFKVGTAVGSSGALHPLVAAWLPNALFLVAGLYLMVRVRT